MDKMTDPVIMAEEIGRLREMNKRLEAEIYEAKNTIAWGKANRVAWSFIAFFVTAVIIAIPVYPTVKTLTTPSVIDYCYVERKTISAEVPAMYMLKGNIEWHEDIEQGVFTSLDEAIKAGERLGCPITRHKE